MTTLYHYDELKPSLQGQIDLDLNDEKTALYNLKSHVSPDFSRMHLNRLRTDGFTFGVNEGLWLVSIYEHDDEYTPLEFQELMCMNFSLEDDEDEDEDDEDYLKNILEDLIQDNPYDHNSFVIYENGLWVSPLKGLSEQELDEHSLIIEKIKALDYVY